MNPPCLRSDDAVPSLILWRLSPRVDDCSHTSCDLAWRTCCSFLCPHGPGLYGRGQATRICTGYLCCKIFLPSMIWVSCIFQSLLYRRRLVIERVMVRTQVWMCVKYLVHAQYMPVTVGVWWLSRILLFQHESLWGLFQEREGRGCHRPPGAGCCCPDSREVDPENLGAKVVLDQGSVADETVV